MIINAKRPAAIILSFKLASSALIKSLQALCLLQKWIVFVFSCTQNQQPLFNTRVNVTMSSRVQFHIHAAFKVMLIPFSSLHLFGLMLFCQKHSQNIKCDCVV